MGGNPQGAMEDLDPADSSGLIDPSNFPIKASNLHPEQIRMAGNGLSTMGDDVNDRMDDVSSSWSGLSAHYEAPEQDVAYDVMNPAVTDADEFDDRMTKADKFIETYADSVETVKTKLSDLESRASTFRTEAQDGYDVKVTDPMQMQGSRVKKTVNRPWNEHTPAVEKNTSLIDEYADLMEELSRAASTCGNSISGLITSAEADPYEPVTAGMLTSGAGWGPAAAEDRSCEEQTGDGAFRWGKAQVTTAGALIGFDPVTGDWSARNIGRSWLGVGDFILSAAFFSTPQGILMFWGTILDDRFPVGSNPVAEFYDDRRNTYLSGIGTLVGYDHQATLAGENGWHGWTDGNAVATGTETLLNIGTFFIPVAGQAGSAAKTAAAGARTASMGSRAARMGAAALRSTAEMIIPGGSYLVHGGAKVVNLATGAVRKLDFDRLGRRPGPGATPDTPVSDALELGTGRPGALDAPRPKPNDVSPGHTPTPDAPKPRVPDSATPSKPDADAPTSSKPDTRRPDVEPPSGNKPSADTPAESKPDAESPTRSKPDEGKPDAETPTGNKSDAKSPTGNKPDAGKPDAETPTGNKPDAGKPDAESPTGNKPDAGKPDAEAPSGNKPDAGKPDAKDPSGSKTDAETPTRNKPDAGKPDAESPTGNKPDAGEPDAQAPSGNKPDAGKPDAESPTGNKPDAGKPDAETPTGNKPDAETPAGNKPDAETPSGNKPDAETPRGNQPDAGTPEPGASNPATPERDVPESSTPGPDAPEANSPSPDGAESGRPTGNDGQSPSGSNPLWETPRPDRVIPFDENLGPRTPFPREGHVPNAAYEVPGRGTYYTNADGVVTHVDAIADRAQGARLNPDLNYPAPDTTYRVVDHESPHPVTGEPRIATYRTDGLGRTESVHIENLHYENPSGRSDSVQQRIGGLGTTEIVVDGETITLKYDGGHLHGRESGGIREGVNYVPMDPGVNRGTVGQPDTFAAFEANMKQLYGDNPGAEIDVQLDVIYDTKQQASLGIRERVPTQIDAQPYVDGVPQDVQTIRNY